MTRAPDETEADGDVEGAASAPARYCAGCLYDLGACAESGACPECGRAYDARIASTVLPRPRRRWRERMFTTWGVRALIALLVLAGFTYSVFPRPARLNDWRLWVWLGRPIGVLHIAGSTTDTYRRYWFGDETRRECIRRSDGEVVWRLRQMADHRYRVEVREPGVHSSALLSAFVGVKGRERMFGIVFDSPPDVANRRPFAAEGDEPAVLSALIREYGYTFRSFRLTPEQAYVWVWDEAAREMTTVDSAGYTARLQTRREGAHGPLIPPRAPAARSP